LPASWQSLHDVTEVQNKAGSIYFDKCLLSITQHLSYGGLSEVKKEYYLLRVTTFQTRLNSQTS